MKPRKTAPPRRRVSFAVDRDEIEINSDWVQAVMASPALPVAPAFRPPVPPVSAPEASLPPVNTPAERPFFVSGINNATGAELSSGERCTPVEQSATDENKTSVAKSAAVEHQATVKQRSTVETLAPVVNIATGTGLEKPPTPSLSPSSTVAHNTTVAPFATGEFYAPVEPAISTEDHHPLRRQGRPRPIRRITDGLTPGQFAVYSLMYEAGNTEEGAAPDSGSRIYRGGYADLCRLTGLSKRGIQNIVGELQDKHVIQIHQSPGYHRTETTAYRVPAADTVLRAWMARGLRYATGKSKTLSSTG